MHKIENKLHNMHQGCIIIKMQTILQGKRMNLEKKEALNLESA